MLACGLARYSSQLLVFQLEILLSTVDPLLGHATPLYARTPYRYLSLSEKDFCLAVVLVASHSLIRSSSRSSSPSGFELSPAIPEGLRVVGRLMPWLFIGPLVRVVRVEYTGTACMPAACSLL
jgi:hypothetical protein